MIDRQRKKKTAQTSASCVGKTAKIDLTQDLYKTNQRTWGKMHSKKLEGLHKSSHTESQSNRAYQYHQKLAGSLGNKKKWGLRKIDQLHRHSFLASLRWAVRGFYYAFRTQRNFRIELIITVFTFALGLFFGIAKAEWSIILLSISLVLGAELANTALEYMVDLYEKKFNYLAMMAKDIAAACVLLNSFHAVVQGILVFGPYVVDIVKKAFLSL